jgi:hypothetical protein
MSVKENILKKDGLPRSVELHKKEIVSVQGRLEVLLWGSGLRVLIYIEGRLS